MSASGLGTHIPYAHKNLDILLFLVESIIGSLKSDRKPKSNQFLKCHSPMIYNEIFPSRDHFQEENIRI